MTDTIRYLTQPVSGDSGPGRVAYRHVPGKAITGKATGQNNPTCGILFCGGFNSNMDGGKAEYLHQRSEESGVSFTRFDYRGHGASDGRFIDGTIGDWLADADLILSSVCDGPQVLVGSSMGAWIALLLAWRHTRRIRGLVLIAPAPDFTRNLATDPEASTALAQSGIWYRASEYSDDPYTITRRLIEEGAEHEILDGPKLAIAGPVHILHGDQDAVVPVAHARRVAAHIDSPSVTLEIIPGGDHRLSKDSNLQRLWDVTYSIATSASR